MSEIGFVENWMQPHDVMSGKKHASGNKGLNRGPYMSAHVLWNLSNEL